MMFNDSDGVYTYTFEAEKKEDCVSCSTKPVTLTFTTGTTLQEVYDYLRENMNLLVFVFSCKIALLVEFSVLLVSRRSKAGYVCV